MFISMLGRACNGGITPDIALQILEESREPKNALELFQLASKLRDETIGRDLWWSAGISGILPCKVIPRCRYCTYSGKENIEKEPLLEAVKKIEDMGLRHIHLSGGTDFNGYTDEIVDLVKAVKEISDMEIEVNLGPSISEETVKALKALGVSSITSSLESFSDEVFRTAKPGDSLEKRKALIEVCEREGVNIRSMMLIGLGETYEDRIRQLFYLKKFSRLYHLRFSRFNPYPGTAFKDRPRCSPWEVARTIAVARLVLPQAELGLAAGNTHDDIPLWYMAGGGNQLLGVHAYKKGKTQPEKESKGAQELTKGVSIVNSMPLISRYVEGLNRNIFFDVQKTKL